MNTPRDKVIVITGASRGLGKVLADMLSQRGARVVISARDKKELESVAAKIGATAIPGDVTLEADMVRLAEETISKYGRIDIWINNAGVWLPRATIEETDMKRAHDVIEVNLFGAVYGSRAALRYMKPAHVGMIVNIISTSALVGRPLSAIYSASKHAAKGFIDSLRMDLEGSGIQLIGIYPGGIKTHLFDEKRPDDYGEYMEPDYVAEKIIENMTAELPLTEQILKRPGQIL